MSYALVDPEISPLWRASDSTIISGAEKIHGWAYPSTWTGLVDVDAFKSNYVIHKKMISDSASQGEMAQAISYVRYPKIEWEASPNSSSAQSALVTECYDKLEAQLTELSKFENEVTVIEEGAVSSALTVIDQLKRRNMAPPELSWHGGDAVVMLWALGDTTYAITVTNGELGYVVRRNRKAIRMEDSIALDAFKLSDLR